MKLKFDRLDPVRHAANKVAAELYRQKHHHLILGQVNGITYLKWAIAEYPESEYVPYWQDILASKLCRNAVKYLEQFEGMRDDALTDLEQLELSQLFEALSEEDCT